MKVLIIFNREPYDMTDVSWNGLRLARTLLKNGHDIRIFLMNDAVDVYKRQAIGVLNDHFDGIGTFDRIGSLFISGIDRLVPVSYTHLDVYKRQRSGNPDR